jgi:hypothetical protein
MTERQIIYGVFAAPFGSFGFCSLFLGNWAGLVLIACAVALIKIGDYKSEADDGKGF